MISDQEMEHLKMLARLELSAEETQALKADLNAILAYFEQLRDLDTEGAQPLVRPIDAVNVFRDDVVQDGLPQDSVLGLAIEAQDGFFRVPRTIAALLETHQNQDGSVNIPTALRPFFGAERMA